jgi:predicted aspartyl protease
MVGIPEGAAVMMGTFSIHGKPVKILFDSGVTHSFMNQSTQINLGLNVLRVKNEYKIATPIGKISSNTLVKSVPLQLGSNVFQTNLLTLGLDGIDDILGMYWMTHHKVTMDIVDRRIEINSPAVGARLFTYH